MAMMRSSSRGVKEGGMGLENGSAGGPPADLIFLFPLYLNLSRIGCFEKSPDERER
jgi:hypothetical protein